LLKSYGIEVRVPWNLTPYRLQPGDVIEFGEGVARLAFMIEPEATAHRILTGERQDAVRRAINFTKEKYGVQDTRAEGGARESHESDRGGAIVQGGAAEAAPDAPRRDGPE
jgi:hypothetical protein